LKLRYEKNTMTATVKAPKQNIPLENRSTRLYVTIQGILGGLIAMIHGISEVLQGNRPTGGNWLVSIGAFTLIHNYLFTGVVAILVGLGLLVWTAGWIHTRHGAAVFLLISVILFLVGGGVAQVAFFLIAWAVALQIRRPLEGWRRRIPGPKREQLANRWKWYFTAGYVFLAAGILIWLFLTPPGAATKDPVAQYLCWACLLVGLVFQLLTIVAGFARDIQRRGLEQ